MHRPLLLALVALGIAACGRPPGGALAVAHPLEQLDGHPIPGVTQLDVGPQLDQLLRGITLVGRPGDVLNFATRLHAELLQRKIANRIEVVQKALGNGQVRARLTITFPGELTHPQHTALRQLFVTLHASFRG